MSRWIDFSIAERKAMIQRVVESRNIDEMAAEKDWWVTSVLCALFNTSIAKYLLFKGGTSLSKGWNLINRFSEDVDLALDRSFLELILNSAKPFQSENSENFERGKEPENDDPGNDPSNDPSNGPSSGPKDVVDTEVIMVSEPKNEPYNEPYNEPNNDPSGDPSSGPSEKMGKNEFVLKEIKLDSSITRKMLAQKLGLSDSTIKRVLAKLKSTGKLKRVGDTFNGYWVVIEN